MPTPLVTLDSICKSFGSLQILKEITLSIHQGEITSIVGPSGAGKTTLLQIIGTLLKPDKGELSIGGVNPFALSAQKQAHFRNKQIGFVFQFHQLLPEFTAAENVAIPAMIAGMSKRQALSEAEQLLTQLGLADRLKQRTAVARALINRPTLILADEPSGSLDTQRKEELIELFFELRDQLGQTFLIVTHDEDFAQRADRTLSLQDGRIIADTYAPDQHE